MFGVTPTKTSYIGLYRNLFARVLQALSDPIQVVHACTDETDYPDAELTIRGVLSIALGSPYR